MIEMEVDNHLPIQNKKPSQTQSGPYKIDEY